MSASGVKWTSLVILLSKSTNRLAATPISILWRVVTTIGPRLGPAFVEWDLAVIDTLLVFPFCTEPFLASELCSPVRWRDRAHGLTGMNLATRLGTDAQGSQRGGHQGDCERLIRQELHD